jgi:tetratricopeptide (TPR) repeat protein
MKSFINKLFGRSKENKLRQIQKLSREWSKQFIGRNDEIETFRNLINSDDLDEWIIELQGIGGVGKSTLLMQFAAIAASSNIKFAIADHRQKSAIEMMRKLSDDLELLGSEFGNFAKKYKHYSELKYKVLHDQDQEKPEQVFEFLGMGVAELGSLASKMHPVAETIMQAGGKQAVQMLTENISAYLYKKFSIDEVELLIRSELLLTQEFVKDLEDITGSTKVVLCFDTFEQTKGSIELSLLNLLVPSLARLDNVLLVISGRELLSDDWDIYRPIICEMHLSPFTSKEVSDFLMTRGITNTERVNELYTGTKGLPLLLQWETINPQGTSASFGKVNRFLNSIQDDQLRESVIICAIPRHFNKDVVTALIPDSNAGELFNVIRILPGVFEKENYWEFHEIIRESLLDYKKKESPKEYNDYHRRAYQYYQAEIQAKMGEGSTITVKDNGKWEELEIEKLYHFLIINETEAIQEFHKEFGRAMAQWNEEALTTLLEIIKQVELKSENRKTVNMLVNSKTAVDKRDFAKAMPGLEFLSDLDDLPLDEKCMILRTIGIIYRNEGEFGQAKAKFEEVIDLLPSHPQAYEELARAYLTNQQPENAIQTYRLLADRNKGTELSAIRSVGLIYLEQQNYNEVKNIINELKKLAPECIELYALSVALEEKQQAWDNAITLHTTIGQKFPEHFVVAQFNIGEIYFILENLEKVRELAEHLIANNPDEAVGYYLMATYHAQNGNETDELTMLYEVSKRSPSLAYPRLLQRQLEAVQQGRIDKVFQILVDFQEATVDEEILFGQSMTWRIFGDDDKAVMVFRRILQQNPSSILAYCNLGDLFWSKNDLDRAIFYFEKAYQVDSTLKSVVTPLISLYEKKQYIEKANLLKEKSDALEDRDIYLVDHSLVGYIHLPLELLQMKQELRNSLPEIAEDFAEMALTMGLFLLLDMTEEFLKTIAFWAGRTFATQDLTTTLFNSVENFLSKETPEEHKKLLQATYQSLDNFEEGYNHLIAIENQDYEIVAERYTQIGLMARRTGQLEIAEKCFQKAKGIYPELPQIYIELGLLYLDKGENKRAIEIFGSLSRNNLKVMSILVEQLIAAGYFNVIDDVVSLAHTTNDKLAEFYGAVGLKLLQHKHLSEAEKFFKKVLEVDPNIHRAYFDLADVYKEMGKTKDQISILEKLLELEPNSQDAQQRLLAVKARADQITNGQDIDEP